MKFSSILMIVAACNATRLVTFGDDDKKKEGGSADPAGSASARSTSLQTAISTVNNQQSYEKDHAAAHKQAMANAEQECQDHKNGVRTARHRQITEGNQYPPFKTY